MTEAPILFIQRFQLFNIRIRTDNDHSIALLNTIISLYYYLLVVKAMFINKTEEAIAPVRSDIYTRLSLIVCTAGILILGLLSTIYEHIGMFSFGITF